MLQMLQMLHMLQMLQMIRSSTVNPALRPPPQESHQEHRGRPHRLCQLCQVHVLTKIRQTRKGVVKKESDHNVLMSEFACKIYKSEETTQRNTVLDRSLE